MGKYPKKITVLTPTFRGWDMLDWQRLWLQRDGFPPEDMEWVIVDDLYAERKDWVAGFHAPFAIKHLLPRTLSDKFDAIGAFNTGLVVAEGEIVFFLVDYIEPRPGVLQRHWDLYQEFGPTACISGEIYDAPLPGWPESLDTERFAEVEIRAGLGEWVSDSTISRFANFGLNDSAPLEALLDVNGMDERMRGMRGGGDAELGIRLARYGCRFLFFRGTPVYRHPKTPTKPGVYPNPIWEELVRVAQTGHSTWAPNRWDIREERMVLHNTAHAMGKEFVP